MPTKSEELATPDAAEISAASAEIQKAYAVILGDEDLPAAADPELVSRAIMERILKAESFEETFRSQELEGWQAEYLDVPVFVRDFHLNPSGFDAKGSSPVYAVVDLALAEDGEVVTVSVGGRNVLMQLVKMREKGWLDKPVKLIAKQTNAEHGGKALWLVDAAGVE